MRLLKKQVEKGGDGNVTVRIEDDEDLWQLYNLTHVGDTVRASTFRKIQNVGATGSVATNKVRLNLTIKVMGIDFDPQSSTIRYSVCRRNSHAGYLHRRPQCCVR